MLPKGYKTVVNWFQEVAADAGFVNPEFRRYDNDDSDAETERQEAGAELTADEPAGERIEELN
jgi:hypothetical protein